LAPPRRQASALRWTLLTLTKVARLFFFRGSISSSPPFSRRSAVTHLSPLDLVEVLAHQCVEHDDVNVMCIGAQIVGSWLAKDLISSYLAAEFSTDEDFRRRVEKLRVMDEEG
jgi:hypothetical protein